MWLYNQKHIYYFQTYKYSLTEIFNRIMEFIFAIFMGLLLPFTLLLYYEFVITNSGFENRWLINLMGFSALIGFWLFVNYSPIKILRYFGIVPK
jgi:hypothetical protein